MAQEATAGPGPEGLLRSSRGFLTPEQLPAKETLALTTKRNLRCGTGGKLGHEKEFKELDIPKLPGLLGLGQKKGWKFCPKCKETELKEDGQLVDRGNA